MVRPQSENLNRSGTTPLDPNSIGGALEARPRPTADDRTGGPVPPENRPGHHPEVEQDRPDPDAFVARFTGEDSGSGDEEETSAATIHRTGAVAVHGMHTVVRFVGAFAGAMWRVGGATARTVRAEISRH